jgi:hypothetical protein
VCVSSGTRIPRRLEMLMRSKLVKLGAGATTAAILFSWCLYWGSAYLLQVRPVLMWRSSRTEHAFQLCYRGHWHRSLVERRNASDGWRRFLLYHEWGRVS